MLSKSKLSSIDSQIQDALDEVRNYNERIIMSEEQRYRTLDVRGKLELRVYPEHVVATVTVRGSVEQAANAAFEPLFRYISGANLRSESFAMTAPVIQQPIGERLAMTAPVIQKESGADHWTVAFVLPAGRFLEEYPKPTDTQVHLQSIPEELAAALRWSGSWTSKNVARWTDELRDLIAEAGFSEAGEARWARFDPPMKAPFRRRNEIVIPISGKTIT